MRLLISPRKDSGKSDVTNPAILTTLERTSVLPAAMLSTVFTACNACVNICGGMPTTGANDAAMVITCFANSIQLNGGGDDLSTTKTGLSSLRPNCSI